MKLKSDSEKHLIIAGFGGQGVLFLGTTLAEAALIEGKNTTWMPSYGAEMRGGSANCYVIISDDEIPSPIFDEADIMNIVVHKDFRGQGIGTKLLETLVSVAKSFNTSSITLEVNCKNIPAIYLYHIFRFC